MPVTVTLSTVPGRLTRERGYIAKTVELFGPSLATETLTAISTVADIRAAVARFGARVRAEYHRLRSPGGMSAKLTADASFYVSVRLAKGHRKPNGYDTASRGNGLGQEDFMHVADGRPRATEPDAAPAAAGEAAP